MYTYSIWQWILLFFTYSFFGWIWEIIYLSLKNLRPVLDKGILKGPLRTMYGSGAVLLILLTGPIKNSIILSYLAGMIGATIFELIVGYSFERIFGIKCWNYSGMKMNYCGHICLPASLLWGAFTVIFIRFIHPVIHSYIIAIPAGITKILSIILVIIFVLDVYHSLSKVAYAA